MIWLILCLAAAAAIAWYLKRNHGDTSGYDIYEDDTFPTYPFGGWNYYQSWHTHNHGSSFGGGGGSSHSSGGGSGGGGGGSW
jgi:uncharacterized membrane protein YgcG